MTTPGGSEDIASRAARRRGEPPEAAAMAARDSVPGTPLYDALVAFYAQGTASQAAEGTAPTPEAAHAARGGRHGDDDGDGVANHADPDWLALDPATEGLDLPPARGGAFVPRGAGSGRLDAATLRELMGNVMPVASYAALLPGYLAAMVAAGVAGSPKRASQWHAQLGHESVGLKFMSELWGPSAQQRKYEPGTDLARQLGNDRPGDGYRYRGAGPIQVTGRGNFRRVSQWAFARGLVPTQSYFEDNPDELRSARYGFIGAVWYWVAARPDINDLADREDTVTVTRRINGGTTGLADRQARYAAARRLGDRVLPAGGAAPAAARTATREVDMLDRVLVPGRNVGTIIAPVGKASAVWGAAEGVVSVRADGGATVNLWFQTSADTDRNPPGASPTGNVVDRRIAHSRRTWAPIPDGTEYIQYDITTGGAGAIALELRPK